MVAQSPLTVRRPDVPGARSIAEFAAEVGPVTSGPVTVVGGRTQWEIGGSCASDVREVRAPAGIVDYTPSEMIVRVGAGTTVAELDAALAASGQMVALDPRQPEAATVGGVLAVGHSGVRRLRWGPIRDSVLEAHFVSAAGAVIRSGGPVVKNVTGFDLCRLLVGSLGTLGFFAQVVLRTQPRPQAQQWWRVPNADPAQLFASLYRPSSILWDGTEAWVLLEGYPADVDAQASLLGAAAVRVSAPPSLPEGARRSVSPREAEALVSESAGWVAEIGVGLVHTSVPAELRPASAEVATIAARLKDSFDPTRRLNPGRSVG